MKKKRSDEFIKIICLLNVVLLFVLFWAVPSASRWSTFFWSAAGCTQALGLLRTLVGQLPQGCLTSTGPLLSFLKVVLSLLAIDTVNSLGHNS